MARCQRGRRQSATIGREHSVGGQEKLAKTHRFCSDEEHCYNVKKNTAAETGGGHFEASTPIGKRGLTEEKVQRWQIFWKDNGTRYSSNLRFLKSKTEEVLMFNLRTLVGFYRRRALQRETSTAPPQPASLHSDGNPMTEWPPKCFMSRGQFFFLVTSVCTEWSFCASERTQDHSEMTPLKGQKSC